MIAIHPAALALLVLPASAPRAAPTESDAPAPSPASPVSLHPPLTAAEALRPQVLPASVELGIWGGWRWFLGSGENLDHSGSGGARVAVNATRVFALELAFGYSQSETLERAKVVHHLTGTFGFTFHFTPGGRFVPYATVGGGLRYYAVPDRPAGEGTLFDDEGNPLPAFKNPDTDGLFDVGVGLKAYITRRILGRVELRYDLVFGGDGESATVDGATVADRWDNLQFSLGISMMLGGRRPGSDSDGDGIVDAEDYCQSEPEDMDGFEDGDGCPDLDNDHDGLLDGIDPCPDEAETFNGFEDEDGCPDEGPVAAIEPPPPEPTAPPEPTPPPAPPEIVEQFSGILAGVQFEPGSADFQPGAFPKLNAAATALVKYPAVRVEIQGHSSAEGDEAFNRDLSQRRAEAVMRYLVNLGVEVRRLVAKGYGDDRPIADNATPEGRSRNRRVEFRILDR